MSREGLHQVVLIFKLFLTSMKLPSCSSSLHFYRSVKLKVEHKYLNCVNISIQSSFTQANDLVTGKHYGIPHFFFVSTFKKRGAFNCKMLKNLGHVDFEVSATSVLSSIATFIPSMNSSRFLSFSFSLRSPSFHVAFFSSKQDFFSKLLRLTKLGACKSSSQLSNL